MMLQKIKEALNLYDSTPNSQTSPEITYLKELYEKHLAGNSNTIDMTNVYIKLLEHEWNNPTSLTATDNCIITVLLLGYDPSLQKNKQYKESIIDAMRIQKIRGIFQGESGLLNFKTIVRGGWEVLPAFIAFQLFYLASAGLLSGECAQASYNQAISWDVMAAKAGISS